MIIMEKQSIEEMLSPQSKRALMEIQLFDDIDSTNAEAIRQIQAGNTENRLLLASSQFAGKGRRGRQWLSPEGAGIYLSLARQFSLEPNQLQGLSLLTAISLKSALNQLGVSALKLKWPNDVLSGKKKLAGILLELQQSGGHCFVVFGVGINVALPAEVVEELDRPVTDITSITGMAVDRNAVVAAFVNELSNNLEEYEENGFSSFKQSWNESDYYLNSDIVIQNGETRIIGKSLGVDQDGALLLQTATGTQTINGGEVFPSLREISDEARAPLNNGI